MTRGQAIGWRLSCVLGAFVGIAIVEIFGDQLRRRACQR